MRKLLNAIYLLAIVAIAASLNSCNEQDMEVLCLPEPCGTLSENATNLVLATPGNAAITAASIMIDDQQQDITLAGQVQEDVYYISCWQTIPDISAESVVVLSYELGGEIIIGTLNVTALSSTNLVIEIQGDSAEISDYKKCEDNIVL